MATAAFSNQAMTAKRGSRTRNPGELAPRGPSRLEDQPGPAVAGDQLNANHALTAMPVGVRVRGNFSYPRRGFGSNPPFRPVAFAADPHQQGLTSRR